MTPARKRRLYWVLGILAGVGIAGALALSAFQKNVMFFFDPSQVAAGEVKQGERFRLGGMVSKGSFHRQPGSLEVSFTVTDYKNDLPVKYTGVLPDLFREGQGVVAHGRMGTDGVFVADEVLAKHDEKYMPPEVARSLKKNSEAYVPKDGEGSGPGLRGETTSGGDMSRRVSPGGNDNGAGATDAPIQKPAGI